MPRSCLAYKYEDYEDDSSGGHPGDGETSSPYVDDGDNACSDGTEEHEMTGFAKRVCYPNWIRVLAVLGTLSLGMGLVIGFVMPNVITALMGMVGAILLIIGLSYAERIYMDAAGHVWAKQ